jgi:hypothetical protein
MRHLRAATAPGAGETAKTSSEINLKLMLALTAINVKFTSSAGSWPRISPI